MTKWSSDLRDFLTEVCELMGISFTMQERFITHRLLAVYDLSLSTYRLLDAYKIFYFAFMPADMKARNFSQPSGDRI